jgi:hypothetical protein
MNTTMLPPATPTTTGPAFSIWKFGLVTLTAALAVTALATFLGTVNEDQVRDYPLSALVTAGLTFIFLALVVRRGLSQHGSGAKSARTSALVVERA